METGGAGRDARGERISQEDIARFQALLALTTTDAQLIWARYYSMLTANTVVAVVLSALAAREAVTLFGTIVLVLVAVFGLALTIHWKRLTWRGWELEHYWVAEAKKVKWGADLNPFEPYSRWCIDTQCSEGPRDWIGQSALGVIHLFLVGYGVFAVLILLRFLLDSR